MKQCVGNNPYQEKAGGAPNSPFLLDSHLRHCLHVAKARLQSGDLTSLCTATVSLVGPYIVDSSGDQPSTSLKLQGAGCKSKRVSVCAILTANGRLISI